MNVSLPARVLLGQCIVSGLLSLGAATISPVAAWSVIAGAVSCVLPGAVIAYWVWRRSMTSIVVAMAQPVLKLLLSAALLGGALGGLPGVNALAALLGFTVATIVQPLVLMRSR